MASRRLVPPSVREALLGIPSDIASLERNYLLAADDLDLIGTRRRPENRLGLALHIALLRHPARPIGGLVSSRTFCSSTRAVPRALGRLLKEAERRDNRGMQRRPSTQDLSWLVDLYRNGQLDLDPPYQRRSVWTRGDKQFFLDTIFRNYPSPAIFLHKTIADDGRPTYHVVDGKQRTQTILNFVDDRLRISKKYGDIRLDGKKWSQIQGEQGLMQAFWNYQITIEVIDIVDGSIVNEVFDRLNRNARRLTRQELRHAKFDGWFISQAETEARRAEWLDLGIVTPSRAKRMLDVQFISELMFVVLEQKILGFDQDTIDDLYAKYDESSDAIPELPADDFDQRFSKVRSYLAKMDSGGAISHYAKGYGDFYTLWASVALSGSGALPNPKEVARRYKAFMKKVERLGEQQNLEAFLQNKKPYTLPWTYYNNSRGASTDLNPRTERLESLKASILRD